MEKKRIITSIIFIVFFCFLFVSSGCEEDAGYGEDEEVSLEDGPAEEPKESVSCLTETGGDFEIALYEDNQVLVSLIEPARSLKILKEFEQGQADLVDLYIGVTGETEVPDSVIRMNNYHNLNVQMATERIKDTIDKSFVPVSQMIEDDVDQRVEQEFEIFGGTTHSNCYYDPMTDQEFIDNECGTAQPYVCVTNLTSNYKPYQNWYSHMTTKAYCDEDSESGVTHKIRRKRWGKWKKVKHQYLPQGYFSYISYAAVGTDYLKCEVWDAGGSYDDLYHFYCYVRD